MIQCKHAVYVFSYWFNEFVDKILSPQLVRDWLVFLNSNRNSFCFSYSNDYHCCILFSKLIRYCNITISFLVFWEKLENSFHFNSSGGVCSPPPSAIHCRMWSILWAVSDTWSLRDLTLTRKHWSPALRPFCQSPWK